MNTGGKIGLQKHIYLSFTCVMMLEKKTLGLPLSASVVSLLICPSICLSRWATMDSSVSSQLDSSLNDSLTDGEENQSETSPSPAAAAQVHTCAVRKCLVVLTGREQTNFKMCSETRGVQTLKSNCCRQTFIISCVPAGVTSRRVFRYDCCSAPWSDSWNPGGHPGPADLCYTITTSSDCPGEGTCLPQNSFELF